MNKCSCILLLVAGCALTDASYVSENVDSAFFRLYNRNGPSVDVSLPNAKHVVSQMNLHKLTIIYIHGYLESVVTSGVTPILDALLKYTTANIIAVDYRRAALLFYPLSVAIVPAVGAKVAKSIEKMVEAGVNAKSIHIIGHSLGAQLAGCIGRSLKFKLTRITGLDPAGPLYYLKYPHLRASDAKFVDIIHTDSGVFGLALPTGSVDFYPNFGHAPQPGCYFLSTTSLEQVLCSHHRSWRFFIESLKNKDAFVAVKCQSSLTFATGSCNTSEKAIMGYYTSPETRGVYCLQTGPEEPFGLGSAGALFNATLWSESM
ncbi:phospholipase A1 member A-like [Megachile rotundata]|uniref:phospholipase A1 member A-like n=1 Tax=Megachile rotundata TaxID=143995 RepID=UPI003FCF5BF5